MRVTFVVPVSLSAAVFFSVLFLTGCGAGFAPSHAVPAAIAGGSINGRLYGGRQPIVGARVYLLQAGTNLDAGPGIAPVDGVRTNNRAVSLLTGGTLDVNSGATYGDFYVSTGPTGGFSISGDYTCGPGTQLYLLALGGKPDGVNENPSSALMAVLGQCPDSGTLADQIPRVSMNEISTVAAAYALAGYASDATHISSSTTPLAAQGMANAFAQAGNLYDISSLANATGGASAQDATMGGNGVVPQALINSLANVLAACVNSTSSGACSTLFSNARSGGLSGTMPTETATAAINIAHNPAVAISTIFNIPSGVVPYTPNLGATAPNDFTVAIKFTGGGLSSPQELAVDGLGNVWASNAGNNSVAELSPLGAALSPDAGFTDGALNGPRGLAIDLNGNAWVANSADVTVSEFSAAGVAAAGSPFTPLYKGRAVLGLPFELAVDGLNNVYVSDALASSGSVVKIDSTGAYVDRGGLGYVLDPQGVAVDSTGTVWTPSYGQATLDAITFNAADGVSDAQYTDPSLVTSSSVAVDNLGVKWVTDPTGNQVTSLNLSQLTVAFGGDSLSFPAGIAIDGAGSVWLANTLVEGNARYAISELTNAGTQVNGVHGYQAGSALSAPRGIAVDGAGNVWVASAGTNALVEFVGAGSPVATPLAYGAANNRLGARP